MKTETRTGLPIEITSDRATVRRIGAASPSSRLESPGGHRESPDKSRDAVAPYRSKLEARRAQDLALQTRLGEIYEVAYESLKLNLGTGRAGGVCWYLIDFVIDDGAPRLICEEVKGYMRDDAAVKFKSAARLYRPFYRFRLVTWQDGGWQERWLA